MGFVESGGWLQIKKLISGRLYARTLGYTMGVLLKTHISLFCELGLAKWESLVSLDSWDTIEGLVVAERIFRGMSWRRNSLERC